MSLHRYDEYLFDPADAAPELVLDDVLPLWSGNHITGFMKVTSCAEIADLHDRGVIRYVPEMQRGYKVRYQNGSEVQREYMIDRRKVKAIAKNIADNREHNRFRLVNCRHGSVQLHFEPYGPGGETRFGRLAMRRTGLDAEATGFLTIPDSAHRQEGDRFFTHQIAPRHFSPEHAGFSPATYDLILHITLTDRDGEGQAHFEHNELVSTSSSTRRAFLEGGQQVPANWVVHQLMQIDPDIKRLVETTERSISKNASAIVTFNTLAKGVAEGWRDWLSESSKHLVAEELARALKLARAEIPEWGILPFARRKIERERFLYSQAIVHRAMVRIFADWFALGSEGGTQSVEWERWRPALRALKGRYRHRDGWEGEFLDRANPLFWEGGIYQLGKGALARKQEREAAGQEFEPARGVVVQNTRHSLDFMYRHLKAFLDEATPG